MEYSISDELTEESTSLFTIEEKGEIELRGKERKLPLYGISAATATKTVDA